MPPKRNAKNKQTANGVGKKKAASKGRKAPASSKKTTPDSQEAIHDSKTDLTPIDRATWKGWVEVESEPAFFNIMLKEMGVRGVRVEDVPYLDHLHYLDRPIHGLIFLFRYTRKDSASQSATGCPDHIWFANQVPEFACATFAILNIVNNIPGLTLGKELREFKDTTDLLPPLARGDKVNDFDFVRRIHNSFATNSDIMQADMFIKAKANELEKEQKKKEARAKAMQTKKAKKHDVVAAHTPPDANPIDANTTPSRRSKRKRAGAEDVTANSPIDEAAGLAGDDSTESPIKRAKYDASTDLTNGTSKAKSPRDDPDGNFEPSSKKAKKPVTDDAKASENAADEGTSVQKANQGVRRSGRQSKSTQNKVNAAMTEADDDAEIDPDAGFHFVAFMPINGRVWKLDGMDRFPHDLGSIENGGGEWTDLATPILRHRMEQSTEINFSLMAIVHDTAVDARQSLVENVKTLQAIDEKLDSVEKTWKEWQGAGTKSEVITAESLRLGITVSDLETARPDKDLTAMLAEANDMTELIQRRTKIVGLQTNLRDRVQDSERAKADDEKKAKHRRHDYATFVKSWLGALADNEVLSALADE